jgi:hypothetical protein
MSANGGYAAEDATLSDATEAGAGNASEVSSYDQLVQAMAVIDPKQCAFSDPAVAPPLAARSRSIGSQPRVNLSAALSQVGARRRAQGPGKPCAAGPAAGAVGAAGRLRPRRQPGLRRHLLTSFHTVLAGGIWRPPTVFTIVLTPPGLWSAGASPQKGARRRPPAEKDLGLLVGRQSAAHRLHNPYLSL